MIATKDNSSHEEVQEANAAYTSSAIKDKHYAEETDGPKSNLRSSKV